MQQLSLTPTFPPLDLTEDEYKFMDIFASDARIHLTKKYGSAVGCQALQSVPTCLLPWPYCGACPGQATWCDQKTFSVKQLHSLRSSAMQRLSRR